MALGKKCKSFSAVTKRGGLVGDGDEGLDLGTVRCSRAFGRKRIVISNNGGGCESTPVTPLKKRRGRRDVEVDWDMSSDSSSHIEALPRDLLIKVLCGVDHGDLDQLSNVSKVIRDATQVAKESHFAYSTPKKVRPFRTAIDFDWPEDDDIEAPNAPRQPKPIQSHRIGKNLGSISVNLFS